MEEYDMKKHYETPIAEKLIFNYQENVVAASGSNVKDGRDPSHPSYNACLTQNTSDNSTHNSNPCQGNPKGN